MHVNMHKITGMDATRGKHWLDITDTAGNRVTLFLETPEQARAVAEAFAISCRNNQIGGPI